MITDYDPEWEYVPARLTCCTCGSDLGSADDPYRDPACIVCIQRENQEDDI